jgi:preflagellin peptidase FlaK
VNGIDIIRILLSLLMLIYTSYIDIKTREIFDIIWIIFGSFGFILSIFEIISGSLTLLSFLIPVVFSIIVSVVLGYFGLFGGADVEAFIALSLLNPVSPRGYTPLLNIVSVIFPLSFFSNAAITGASFSLVLLSRNLLLVVRGKNLFMNHEDPWWKKIIVIITGVKVRLDTVRGPPFQYPLEVPGDVSGKGKHLILVPNIHDDEAAERVFAKLREEGLEETWVSNTLPFLVFITIGYVMTIFLGDVALSILGKILFPWIFT